MPRGRNALQHRSGSSRRDDAKSARGDVRNAGNHRIRVAQAAARLIAEHGITDWSLAKRKALRQLMLPEGSALPSNDDVVAALTEHHALFGGVAHQRNLRMQREEALAWMRNLAVWQPL